MLREFIVTFPITVVCAIGRIAMALFAVLLGTTVGFLQGCQVAGPVLAHGVKEADRLTKEGLR